MNYLWYFLSLPLYNNITKSFMISKKLVLFTGAYASFWKKEKSEAAY